MPEYTVTKERIVEVMTRIPADIVLFKNLETGKIVGELVIENTVFGTFSLDESDMSCLPNDNTWKPFFESQFIKFDTTDLIRNTRIVR